jgi:predicted RNA binding protein YcfA (HicA-like mRNA interferase family)
LPKPPIASGLQVRRALERAGFEFVRQNGSHAIMANRGTGRVAVVPMHGGRDLQAWTINSILDQAGISADELRELLK